MPDLSRRWEQTLCSEVNTDFVSNPYPRQYESITVALRMDRYAPVRDVWIRGLSDGISFRIKMDHPVLKGRFHYYHVELEMDTRCLRYRFEIETDHGFLYVTSKGVQSIPPVEDHDFVIIADFPNPEWVPGSVFYQIFPDRFRNGDPSVGVREGEYQYDGAETCELVWGSDPLEYDEGRCVDFYNGDLAGIEQSIPYFEEMCIDALYLNPIFRAKTNHRYDCIDYFHVDEHLGGDEALVQLMRSLHEAGMHAVVDVSINHTGIDHEWFRRAKTDPDSDEAGFYYRLPNGDYAYWLDVPTLPQLNYGSEALRKKIWKDPDALVRKYLKKPFDIDGWRFDVANQVGRRGSDQFCHEIWREIRKAVKEENRQAYIIGEHWEDALEYLMGDQWDGAMNYFASGRPLRMWMGELDRFLMHNWGHDPVKGRSITGYELQQAIEQHLSRLPNQMQFLQFNLIDSHDTPRLYHHDAVWDWDIYRGVILLLFSLPGAVSYLYGDEIGLRGHPRSVEGARYPMEWDRTRWNPDHTALYRRMGEIRHEYRDLFAYGAFRTLLAGREIYICARFLNDLAVVTVVNRSGSAGEIEIPVHQIGICDCEQLVDTVRCIVDKGILRVHLSERESTMLLCRCDV